MHSADAEGHLSQRRLGDILVSEGVISEEQLQEAVQIPKTDKRNLGSILVSLGYITPDDLAHALSMRLNVEYVDLSETEIDPEVLGIIGEDVLFHVHKN